METKYVRSHDGIFAIFSEGLGMQHIEMAEHIDDARNMSDAGLVMEVDGHFAVYDKSLSLGINSKAIAEVEMDKALADGAIRLYWYESRKGEGYIATNAHLLGDYEVATDFETLKKKRVLA